MMFLLDAENGMVVSSFVWTKYRNVTDGQTHRQMDGRADRYPLAITAL